MSEMIQQHGLKVAASLSRFIGTKPCPEPASGPLTFWWKDSTTWCNDLAPKNRALLAERDRLQVALDEWHRAHPGPIADPAAYRAFWERSATSFLSSTVRKPRRAMSISKSPNKPAATGRALSNLRYALNAANARWGSFV